MSTRNRKIGIIAGAGLGAAAAAALRSRWRRGSADEASGDEPQSAAAVAFIEHLAEAVRIPTVSHEDRERVDRSAFAEFRSFLERTYPAVHGSLGLEVVGGDSPLFTWEGTDPDAEPFLLMAHQDVVPVDPATEAEWPHGPFSGEVADGYLWGRGALDDKGPLIAILEAVESLVEEGFTPATTVYLAFGHDEEIGGGGGASAIAALLGQRGVRLAFVLDKGGAVASDFFPGVTRPVALVGIGEKGYVNVEISARRTGGHASVPPASTAIGAVAAAVHRLEGSPMPARLEPARPMFEALGRVIGGVSGRMLARPEVFGAFIERRMAGAPQTDALIRTTAAVTMISGGVKPNLLPQEATAVVNVRVLPGDASDDVLDHVRRVVGDGVTVDRLPSSFSAEPSPLADVEAAAFTDLAATIDDVFPGVPVVPYILMGATDSRYFLPIAGSVLRFVPFSVTGDDMARIHGVGERVRVADASSAVAFYRRLIIRSAGLD
jgi:carboxypeptidase PM20D1